MKPYYLLIFSLKKSNIRKNKRTEEICFILLQVVKIYFHIHVNMISGSILFYFLNRKMCQKLLNNKTICICQVAGSS